MSSFISALNSGKENTSSASVVSVSTVKAAQQSLNLGIRK